MNTETPTPVEERATEQRARQLLALACGALWESARIAWCEIGDGSTTYVAIAPVRGRPAVLFVTEQADGQMIVTALPY